MRILVVEDEEKLAEALKLGLEKNGYAVDTINDGSKALARISLNHIDYDLIILDLMLPGLDGFAITKYMREHNIQTPILVLTSRDEIESKIDLFKLGADDYLVKPFSFEELFARLQSIFRRPKKNEPVVLEVQDVVLDTFARKVFKDEKEVPLTLKEFSILEYFMRNPNKIINREELFNQIWDFNYDSFSNVMDVHIKNIRRKLGAAAEGMLETIRGVGYRLKD